MKKEILIIKNATHEGAGTLKEELINHNIKYTIANFDKKENFSYAKNYGAVIVLGGPDSANDNTGKIKTEISCIRKIIEENIPYLGICLGLQILVKAAGGQVVKCSKKEVGFIDFESNTFTVELTEEGKQDPLFEGLNHKFDVFQLHEETVVLTKDMVRLGVGKFCENQIVRVGSNAYGVQYHFELTPEMLELWLNKDPDLHQLDRIQLQTYFETIRDVYMQTGRQLFRNFLKIANIIQK